MLSNCFKRKFSKTIKPLAYVNGTSEIPLINEHISELLRRKASKYPKNMFQIFPQHNVRYTYEEFNQRVDEIAKGFIALGLQKGDRVGMYSPNRPEWALTQYA